MNRSAGIMLVRKDYTMRAYERLLKYVVIDTRSDDACAHRTPSTDRQWELAKLLETEMREMGLTEVYLDEHAYVYGVIPATPGYEDCRKIGFIAHIDLNSDFGEGGAKPQIIENYDGGDIVLGSGERVIEAARFPHLARMKGKTVITTDGTTVLGADDKAGVAEILTMCEEVLRSGHPHGRIAVCFTPDEEIGHGAALLDLERFGAEFAYTVDGSVPNEMEYETFNAAAAEWEITGFSVHPGEAKNVMINAALVAMEINAMLPAGEIPRDTSGYEGFFHLHDMAGDVVYARMEYIIRDHDEVKFNARKELLRRIERTINEKYGDGVAKLTITDQYSNMATVIRRYPEVMEKARAAIEAAGLTPASNPVRGGTDGAQLSFRGLPCPNLGTGGYCYHGPYEHCVAEEMDTVVEILVNIVSEYAKK